MSTPERPPKWDAWLPEAERLPEDAWQAAPDADWRVWLPGDAPRLCRFGSPFAGFCRRPAVAFLRRGRRGREWAYCERHMYGRWIEDGRVLNWTVKPDFRQGARL